MAAFQPYTGAYRDEREAYSWSCYATCPVYEVRAFRPGLPPPPADRKWVRMLQYGQRGPQLAMLVDHRTADFSQMLAQISAPRPLVEG